MSCLLFCVFFLQPTAGKSKRDVTATGAGRSGAKGVTQTQASAADISSSSSSRGDSAGSRNHRVPQPSSVVSCRRRLFSLSPFRSSRVYCFYECVPSLLASFFPSRVKCFLFELFVWEKFPRPARPADSPANVPTVFNILSDD